VRARTWSPKAIAVIVAAAIAVAGWFAWRHQQPDPRPAGAKAPVVAVLAFANMSDDPRQEFFSDGLSENVIDSLAHVRDLQVIARNSSFRYKGKAADVRVIGQELGAAYVVEGSVRRSADTVRVTAQLIDAKSGAHLWSQSYDRELNTKNVFAIQDEIAQGIVSTVVGFSGVVRQQELALVKAKPPSELSSYECVLLGMQYLRVLSLKNFRQARDCLEPAVKLEPDYASLWRYLAYVYSSEYQQGFDPRPNSLDRALEAAQRAAQLAPGDVDIEAQLAIIHFFRGELNEFKSLAHRLAKLPPNGSVSVGGVGLFLCYADEWETGLAMIDRAKALDPYFPGWYLNGEFHDHLRKGEAQAALETAQRINLPDFPQALSQLVAAYGALNRPQDAKPYVERIRKLDPAFESHVRDHWTARFRYQPQYLEVLLDAMRKGGLNVPPK
jgi:adenylate cyclase